MWDLNADEGHQLSVVSIQTYHLIDCSKDVIRPRRTDRWTNGQVKRSKREWRRPTSGFNRTFEHIAFIAFIKKTGVANERRRKAIVALQMKWYESLKYLNQLVSTKDSFSSLLAWQIFGSHQYFKLQMKSIFTFQLHDNVHFHNVM